MQSSFSFLFSAFSAFFFFSLALFLALARFAQRVENAIFLLQRTILIQIKQCQGEGVSGSVILLLLIDTHADFLEANTPRALCLHLYYRPYSPPSPLVPSPTVIALLPIVLHCMLFGLFALHTL